MVTGLLSTVITVAGRVGGIVTVTSGVSGVVTVTGRVGAVAAAVRATRSARHGGDRSGSPPMASTLATDVYRCVRCVGEAEAALA
jgi:hypothetical protein